MKVLHETGRGNESGTGLDLATIRRRVAGIKSRWTPEIAQARASEGARRRKELDALLGELLLNYPQVEGDDDAASCQDTHGLSLVG